ncbi:MAG: YhcH/YjgK/YiaL family protein [Salinivirgaceae bacterium]|jgi:YhcH/YjgK/YiaL family protein|nr:YhcH/YjgK/YiaL family protein [Salinivirgaceae bacterium]
MIFDKIENINLYEHISENLNKAIRFIQMNNINDIAVGKHEISGTDVFVLISEYQTKVETDCKPEAHEKYIDIQMMLSGSEYMGYTPLKEQEITHPYNSDKDVVFFKSGTNKIKFLSGEFAIFFPNDIHQPGIQIKESTVVKKAVFKVRV